MEEQNGQRESLASWFGINRATLAVLVVIFGLGMAEAGSASHVFDGAPDVSEHQVRHGPVVDQGQAQFPVRQSQGV